MTRMLLSSSNVATSAFFAVLKLVSFSDKWIISSNNNNIDFGPHRLYFLALILFWILICLAMTTCIQNWTLVFLFWLTSVILIPVFYIISFLGSPPSPVVVTGTTTTEESNPKDKQPPTQWAIGTIVEILADRLYLLSHDPPSPQRIPYLLQPQHNNNTSCLEEWQVGQEVCFVWQFHPDLNQVKALTIIPVPCGLTHHHHRIHMNHHMNEDIDHEGGLMPKVQCIQPLACAQKALGNGHTRISEFQRMLSRGVLIKQRSAELTEETVDLIKYAAEMEQHM